MADKYFTWMNMLEEKNCIVLLFENVTGKYKVRHLKGSQVPVIFNYINGETAPLLWKAGPSRRREIKVLWFSNPYNYQKNTWDGKEHQKGHRGPTVGPESAINQLKTPGNSINPSGFAMCEIRSWTAKFLWSLQALDVAILFANFFSVAKDKALVFQALIMLQTLTPTEENVCCRESPSFSFLKGFQFCIHCNLDFLNRWQN